MLIVLTSLELIRRHRPLDVATSIYHRVRTAPPSSAAAPPCHCHLPTPKERRHSDAFLLLFVDADVDCPRLAGVDPAPSSHRRGKQCQYQYGHGSIPVLGTYQVPVPVLALPRWRSFPVRALAKCPYQYWHGYSLPILVKSIVLWKNCR